MGRHGRAGALRAGAIAAALLAGCGSGPPQRPGDDAASLPLRIWISPLVRWGDGAPRAVELALENATHRTLVIAAPHPENAAVAVFAGPESTRVCGVEPRGEARGRGRLELAPGDRAAVRVDLVAACAAVAPGVYRYEVSYRAPEVPDDAPAAASGGGGGSGGSGRSGESGGPRPFSGTLATSYGQVIVEEGARAVDARPAAPAVEPERLPARAGRRPARAR